MTSIKPNFIGIGAQKCASTWLYKMLDAHPESGVSEKKEIDFFSKFYDHGYQWYESQFAHCVGLKAVGEISPSYLCDPSAPGRIKKYAPDIKILLSVRDPIERLLSNHRHEVRAGHLASDDLSVASGIANNPMYIEQGLYAKHLEHWLQHFSRDQLCVVLMEDVKADPEGAARQVYEFLGLDAGFVPEKPAEKYNRSFANRSRSLARVKDSVYSATRSPALNWLWELGKATGLRSVYRSANTVASDVVIPELDAATHEKLQGLFAADVDKLACIIDRPLEQWLK